MKTTISVVFRYWLWAEKFSPVRSPLSHWWARPERNASGWRSKTKSDLSRFNSFARVSPLVIRSLFGGFPQDRQRYGWMCHVSVACVMVREGPPPLLHPQGRSLCYEYVRMWTPFSFSTNPKLDAYALQNSPRNVYGKSYEQKLRRRPWKLQ